MLEERQSLRKRLDVPPRQQEENPEKFEKKSKHDSNFNVLGAKSKIGGEHSTMIANLKAKGQPIMRMKGIKKFFQQVEFPREFPIPIKPA